MRLLYVTSHYPPNWVSGGSLVPQRQAREMARRGHEVEVFAGHVDPSVHEGRQWVETDGHGVSVHWMATTRWTGWGDPWNHSNPVVEAAFVAHLAQSRPDLVHFHSLQSFGGGLLSVAAAAGVRSVVTMHDHWWYCGRQFLVGPDGRPCCYVAKAGTCPCELGSDWRARREQGLAAHLRHAELVLAPSRSHAAVLAANGVDPDLLRVDENGVEAPERVEGAWQAPQRSAGRVRFVYAGGPHPVKGAHVLAAAATSLRRLPGWELDMYGFDLEDDELPRLGPGAPVRLLGPFRESEAIDVLHRYDVLVLPSVARESYSLLCREGLSCGLPVITTDAPGPMEVVRHGENGLVVPSGDDAALAEAMALLARDEAYRLSLAPKPGAVRLRSLRDQADGLEAHYRELMARPRRARAPSGARPLRRVLFVCGIEGAPLRYRARLPQEGLEMLGVQVDVVFYRAEAAPELAQAADAIVLYRVPATRQVLELVEATRARPTPVPILFDIDDLIVDDGLVDEIGPLISHLPKLDQDRYWEGVRRYRATLELCDAFVGSTDPLCRAVSELTGIPSHRYANGVGLKLAQLSDFASRRPRRHGPLRIGYLSGTSTHNHDWASIEPAVLEVLGRRPDVELWLVGLLEPGPGAAALGDRLVRVPLKPWYELPQVLRDIDVNLAPLVLGGRFNEAKSAIKWLEAALVGTPTVASPTEPFREAVEHGVTGVLAHGHDEWVEAIEGLLRDPAARRRIGGFARTAALLRWSPDLQARRYRQVLEAVRDEVARQGPRSRPRATEVVAPDEPYLPFEIERYEVPPWALGTGAGRTLRQVLKDYYVVGNEHLQRNGAKATARKSMKVLKSVPGRIADRVGREWRR